MESKKRKRTDAPHAAVVTYSTAERSFQRIFRETSLEETRDVARQKLGVPKSTRVELYQLHNGRRIDLEDDDDFEAFSALARAETRLEVSVIVHAPARSALSPAKGLARPHKPHVTFPDDTNGDISDSERPAKRPKPWQTPAEPQFEPQSAPPANPSDECVKKKRRKRKSSASPDQSQSPESTPAPAPAPSFAPIAADTSKRMEKIKKKGQEIVVPTPVRRHPSLLPLTPANYPSIGPNGLPLKKRVSAPKSTGAQLAKDAPSAAQPTPPDAQSVPKEKKKEKAVVPPDEGPSSSHTTPLTEPERRKRSQEDVAPSQEQSAEPGSSLSKEKKKKKRRNEGTSLPEVAAEKAKVQKKKSNNKDESSKPTVLEASTSAQAAQFEDNMATETRPKKKQKKDKALRQEDFVSVVPENVDLTSLYADSYKAKSKSKREGKEISADADAVAVASAAEAKKTKKKKDKGRSKEPNGAATPPDDTSANTSSLSPPIEPSSAPAPSEANSSHGPDESKISQAAYNDFLASLIRRNSTLNSTSPPALAPAPATAAPVSAPMSAAITSVPRQPASGAAAKTAVQTGAGKPRKSKVKPPAAPDTGEPAVSPSESATSAPRSISPAVDSLSAAATSSIASTRAAPRKKGKKELRTPCPICQKAPYHLRFVCAVVTAGSASIRARLAEMEREGSAAELLEGLRVQLERAEKREALDREKASEQGEGEQEMSVPQDAENGEDMVDVAMWEGKVPVTDGDTGSASAGSGIEKDGSDEPESTKGTETVEPPTQGTGRAEGEGQEEKEDAEEGPSARALVPAGSAIAEVVVEGADEGSSNDRSDDEKEDEESSAEDDVEDGGDEADMSVLPADIDLSTIDVEALLRGPIRPSSQILAHLSSDEEDGDDGDDDKMEDVDEDVEEEEERDEKAFRRLSKRFERAGSSSDDEALPEEANADELTEDADLPQTFMDTDPQDEVLQQRGEPVEVKKTGASSSVEPEPVNSQQLEASSLVAVSLSAEHGYEAGSSSLAEKPAPQVENVPVLDVPRASPGREEGSATARSPVRQVSEAEVEQTVSQPEPSSHAVQIPQELTVPDVGPNLEQGEEEQQHPELQDPILPSENLHVSKGIRDDDPIELDNTPPQTPRRDESPPVPVTPRSGTIKRMKDRHGRLPEVDEDTTALASTLSDAAQSTPLPDVAPATEATSEEGSAAPEDPAEEASQGRATRRSTRRAASAVAMPPPPPPALTKRRGRPPVSQEEKERRAAEKKAEKERIAAEKKVEKERLAAEKAEWKRLADEQKTAGKKPPASGRGEKAAASSSRAVVPVILTSPSKSPPKLSQPSSDQVEWTTLDPTSGADLEGSMVDELQSSSPDPSIQRAVSPVIEDPSPLARIQWKEIIPETDSKDIVTARPNAGAKAPSQDIPSSDPLFLPSSQHPETQLSDSPRLGLPNSANGHTSSEESGSEVGSAPSISQPRSSAGWSRTAPFRRLSDLHSQFLFNSSRLASTIKPPTRQNPGRSASFMDDDDDDDDDESDSEVEKPNSHIPQERRAGTSVAKPLLSSLLNR